MIKRGIIYNLFLLLTLMVSDIQAQDIHFSQFSVQHLFVNPATSGLNHKHHASISTRNQWSGLSRAYSTTNLAYDYSLKRKRQLSGFWGTGANIYIDRAGDASMSTMFFSAHAAYHIRITENQTLGLGASAGVFQRSINYSAIQWGNQFDGYNYNSSLSSGETQVAQGFTRPDMGAGISWALNKNVNSDNVVSNGKRFVVVGFSMSHLNQPNYSFFNMREKLFTRFCFHSNAEIEISNTRVAVLPGLLFYQQGEQREIITGTHFKYTIRKEDKFTGFLPKVAASAGIWIRGGDAIVPALQFEYGNFTLGLSYDINTSGLTRATNGRGGMEITLRYLFIE